MKLKFVILAVCALFLTSCVERIDARHEGIKFNLASSSKGVDDVPTVIGNR